MTIFEDSGLKASEITGDIVKWLVYDGVENMVVVSHSNDFNPESSNIVTFLSFLSFCSASVRPNIFVPNTKLQL